MFHKVFVICNSEQQFHKFTNMPRNVAIADGNKPDFLTSVADWVENWFLSFLFLPSNIRCISYQFESNININYKSTHRKSLSVCFT